MSKTGSLLFYIFIFSLTSFFFSFYRSKIRFRRKMFVALSLVIPSIVAGIRYQVGTDWGNYSYNMSLIRSLSFAEVFHNRLLSNAEYGFLFVVKILSYYFNNEFIFGFFAFATLAFVVDALLKEYREYDISIAYFMFLFVYFGNSFNLMRQTLAVAIVFWGMKFVYNGQIKKYLVTILCASLIHFTALVAFPIYFFWNRKEAKALKNQYFLLIVFIAGILVVSWRDILNILLGSSFSFLKKYALYLDKNAARNRDFYLKCLLFLIVVILYHNTKMKNQKLKMFLQMGVINLLIGTTGFYITFFKRIGMYYEVPIIILVGAITRAFVTRSKLLVKILVCILIIAYFILVYYIIGDSKIIPYQVVP